MMMMLFLPPHAHTRLHCTKTLCWQQSHPHWLQGRTGWRVLPPPRCQCPPRVTLVLFLELRSCSPCTAAGSWVPAEECSPSLEAAASAPVCSITRGLGGLCPCKPVPGMLSASQCRCQGAWERMGPQQLLWQDPRLQLLSTSTKAFPCSTWPGPPVPPPCAAEDSNGRLEEDM